MDWHRLCNPGKLIQPFGGNSLATTTWRTKTLRREGQTKIRVDLLKQGSAPSYLNGIGTKPKSMMHNLITEETNPEAYRSHNVER